MIFQLWLLRQIFIFKGMDSPAHYASCLSANAEAACSDNELAFAKHFVQIIRYDNSQRVLR